MQKGQKTVSIFKFFSGNVQFNLYFCTLYTDSIKLSFKYTKITEVNLSVLVNRLFSEDFAPLFRTIIDDFLNIIVHILVGFLDVENQPQGGL